MKIRKSIQISEDAKKRLDRIKADKQCDYTQLINELCEMHEILDIKSPSKEYYKVVSELNKVILEGFADGVNLVMDKGTDK